MTALPTTARAATPTGVVVDPTTDPAAPRTRPPLRLAPARGRGRLLLTLSSLVVVVLAVFAAVTLNAVAADDAVAVQQLDAMIRDAETAYGSLVTEVARLESPARVAEAAAALGLERVDHPRQLRVERLLPSDGIVHDAPRDGAVALAGG